MRLVVHCAGMMATTWRRTVEGIEETAAVNAFGPARLTEALLPLLTATGHPCRVVTVGSFTHHTVTSTAMRRWLATACNNNDVGAGAAQMDMRSGALSPAAAYAASKAAATAHSIMLHRRLAARGISAAVADPGLVDTAINREWPPLLRSLYVTATRLLRLMQPPSVGAAVVIRAGLAPPPILDQKHRGCTAGWRCLFGARGAHVAPSRLVAGGCALEEEVWRTLRSA